jgi:hypothetical protein
MSSTAGLVRDFVGGVLDELEKLSIAVPALGDTALTVGVLGNEAGVDFVRLKNTRGLFQDSGDDRRYRRRGFGHCFTTPGLGAMAK